MYTRRLWLVTIGLIVALVPFPVCASPQDDVLTAETTLNAAIVRHDTAAVANLIAPDYTLTLSDGSCYDHSAFLSLVRNSEITYTADDAHDQRVRVYGDSTAIITGILDIRGTFGTQTIYLHMRYTDTWVRQAGLWVQAAGHSSNLADKPR